MDVSNTTWKDTILQYPFPRVYVYVLLLTFNSPCSGNRHTTASSSSSPTPSITTSSSSSSCIMSSNLDELEHRLSLLKRHNVSLEREHDRLHSIKQHVDHEIEGVLKRHKNHCYLTLEDLARYQTKLAQEVLVIVNAPYNTDITVHSPPLPSTSRHSLKTQPTKVLYIICPLKENEMD